MVSALFIYESDLADGLDLVLRASLAGTIWLHGKGWGSSTAPTQRGKGAWHGFEGGRGCSLLPAQGGRGEEGLNWPHGVAWPQPGPLEGKRWWSGLHPFLWVGEGAWPLHGVLEFGKEKKGAGINSHCSPLPNFLTCIWSAGQRLNTPELDLYCLKAKYCEPDHQLI